MVKPRKFNKEFHEESRRKDFKGMKGKKYNFMELKKEKLYRRLGKYADEVYKVIFGNLYVKDKFKDWQPMKKEFIPQGKVFFEAKSP